MNYKSNPKPPHDGKRYTLALSFHISFDKYVDKNVKNDVDKCCGIIHGIIPKLPIKGKLPIAF
jgi:hypothetical protein